MFDTIFDEDLMVLLNEAPEDNDGETDTNPAEEETQDDDTEEETTDTNEEEEEEEPEPQNDTNKEEEPEATTDSEGEETNSEDNTESNEDTDANAEEVSKEKLELNHKKLHYFDCATEILSTTNNFLIRIQDSYSRVSDEKKYMLSQIEQSLLKEKADLYKLIHDKINLLEPDAINKVLVIFITKIETLCDLVKKIIETEE